MLKGDKRGRAESLLCQLLGVKCPKTCGEGDVKMMTDDWRWMPDASAATSFPLGAGRLAVPKRATFVDISVELSA